MQYISDTYCVVECRLRLYRFNPVVDLLFTNIGDRNIIVTDALGDMFQDEFYIIDIPCFVLDMQHSGKYTDPTGSGYAYINADKQELLWINKNKFLYFDVEYRKEDQWDHLINWLDHCRFPHKPLIE